MQPVETLNSLSPGAFVVAVRPLFEAADPLAEALYAARPFASYAALVDAAEALARDLPFEQQVIVLSAHPRIGADPASVSAASYREQGYAAEAGVDADQLESTYSELAALNANYERRFGFRFVVFVNGRPKAAVLEILRQRLGNSREAELATGLHEMFAIARSRLAT